VSEPRPTVVLAGCGDLGTEIGLRFVDRGARVIGIRRRSELLPASFEGQSIDLSSEVPALPRDTDLVVIALAADAPTEQAYRSAYLDGDGQHKADKNDKDAQDIEQDGFHRLTIAARRYV
jgi:nucleoside-diphosphate-sugar epimerase